MAGTPRGPEVPPGRRLRSILDVGTLSLGRRVDLMWRRQPVSATYRRWLAVSHAMMRATVPLLIAAQEECARRPDPLSSDLLAYYAGQAREELGHETVPLADHARSGGDPADITERIAPGAVARLVGAQYYWIRHEHPIALAGHIAVLEWYPPGGGLAARLSRRTGLPLTAFETLALHAEADGEHGETLLRFLDGLHLSCRLHELLVASALTTLDGLNGVIDAITGAGANPGESADTCADAIAHEGK